MYERGIVARPLILPGIELMPGDLVTIVDSRGRAIRGIFMGYAASFIGLASDCNEKPSRFINIKRINEVIIIKPGYCMKLKTPKEADSGEGEGGKEERGDGAPSAAEGEA